MSDESTFKYQNIEHQQIPENESVSEHQNETSTGRPHIANTGQGVNSLGMRFNGKYYDNVQIKIIGENKERKWGQYCLRIATNFMLTQMLANKGIKLFKESPVKSIDDMNVVGPEILT